MSAEWVVDGVESGVDGFRLGPVDLAIAPGHAVAVLGPSGSGKTTLLRTLAGFVPVRTGRILRGGVDISDWLPEERALGYVPQGLGLLPHRTAEENVRYPMEVRGEPDAARRTRDLLQRFGLESLARRRPARLSGGEQQRVAIARALAARPQLIVWDEPWQGLDVLARHDLGVILTELREAERVPVVIVTHDPSLAFSIADSFLVLAGGRVQEQCDARTLLRAPADPFAARFVGFENVYSPDELREGEPGSLRAWLLDRAGANGVAFAAPGLGVDAVAEPGWTGTIRGVRPTPDGVSIEVVCDRLAVKLRLPRAPEGPLPSLAESARFTISPELLRPLGRTAGGS